MVDLLKLHHQGDWEQMFTWNDSIAPGFEQLPRALWNKLEGPCKARMLACMCVDPSFLGQVPSFLGQVRTLDSQLVCNPIHTAEACRH
jgi:hypothetical protein